MDVEYKKSYPLLLKRIQYLLQYLLLPQVTPLEFVLVAIKLTPPPLVHTAVEEILTVGTGGENYSYSV